MQLSADVILRGTGSYLLRLTGVTCNLKGLFMLQAFFLHSTHVNSRSMPNKKALNKDIYLHCATKAIHYFQILKVY